MISKDVFVSALEEVDNAILVALPDPGECSFQFSDRFEQRMRSVIRRGNHPGIYKTLQRVACVLLVLLMLFSSVMIFSTDARAAIIGWIKEQYETFYHYFFPKEDEAVEKVEYTLGWVPDGFTLVSTQSISTRKTSIYLGPQNQMLQFTWQYGDSAFPAYFDSQTLSHKAVNVGTHKGDLYLSDTEENTNGIAWVDDDRNILFSISAPLNEKALIKVAEGVIQK